MNRLEDMETFVQIVDGGSITVAAERMDIAKSAVSRRLSELEQRLGVQLLNRTTRRLSLTDTGRSFYQRCRQILEDVEEAEQAVSMEHGALKGRIHASVPLSFGLMHLTDAIGDFLAEHPEVGFDMDFNDHQADLIGEGYDLAIRIARLPDSTLIARRLAPVRHVVCASPGYWERAGKPATPQELAAHHSLQYTYTRDPGAWKYSAGDGTEGVVKLPAAFHANNGDFLRDLAIAGHGVIMQPTFLVYHAIDEGLLVPVLREWEWPSLSAYAVYPQSRHLSGRVRAFVDFLAGRFGDAPYWDNCLGET